MNVYYRSTDKKLRAFATDLTDTAEAIGEVETALLEGKEDYIKPILCCITGGKHEGI